MNLIKTAKSCFELDFLGGGGNTEYIISGQLLNFKLILRDRNIEKYITFYFIIFPDISAITSLKLNNIMILIYEMQN